MFRQVLIAFVFILLPFSVLAEDTGKELIEGVSVEDAISYALSTNPDLVSASYSIDLADENIDLARAGYRPTVTAVGEISHIQSNNDLDNEWGSGTPKTIGVNVDQPIYTGGQTTASIKEQKLRKHSVEKTFQGRIQDKILDIVDVYMTTFQADQAMKVYGDNVGLLGEELKAARARFEAGELTKTDVAQAEARVAQAKAELTEATATYEVALASFRRETGFYERVNLFYPELNEGRLPETLDNAINRGLEINPMVKSALTDIEAQSYAIEMNEGALLPQLSLGAGVAYEQNPAFSIYDRQETANVGLSASLPLYQAGVLRNQIRQSKILKSQAVSDLEGVRRDITNDIVAAWENYKSLLVQLEARESQLNASRLAYKGVQLEEEVGARSVLDVLDANQDVRDAELLLINTKAAMASAYYELLGAIGLLDDSLWDKSKRML